MTNTLAAIKRERITSVLPYSTVKRIRVDRQGLIKDHKPTTKILDLLRKADPKYPQYYSIGPAEALDILTLNDDGQNRVIDENQIAANVAEMLADEWDSKNGETFGITKSNKLNNGQHRLWSIYESGVTLEFLIVTGIRDDAFAKTDIGRKRSAADMIAINDYKNESTSLAYTIKNIILFNTRSQMRGSVSDKLVSNAEVNKFAMNKPVMDELVRDLGYARAYWMENSKHFLTAPQWVAIYYQLRTLPGRKQDARKFMDSFASGINLKPKDPIYILHKLFKNGLAEQYENRKKHNVKHNILTLKVKYIFKAWEYSIKNIKSEVLEINKETLDIEKPIF